MKYEISPSDFTRIDNDGNGNPRYVLHFNRLITAEEYEKTKDDGMVGIDKRYDIAVRKANKVGGRRFHTKKYGGGIVFQSYSLPELIKAINEQL
jgi:hypothetical protein